MDDRLSNLSRSAARVTSAVLLALCAALRTQAHEGPPFPILMDQPAAGWMVSVWADPDIGEAQFFVILETPAGTTPNSDFPTVSLWVEPVCGRLSRATYPAAQQTLRHQLQFEARPHFDQRDLWRVGIQLVTAEGDRAELTARVESTPPGYGPWDFAIYLFPFVMIGGMWAYALLRRARNT